MKHFAKFPLILAGSLLAARALTGCATGVDVGGTGTGGASATGSTSTGSGTPDAGPDAPPGTCIHATDCPPIADPCNVPICINGLCAKQPANDLSACDDGLYCTENDTCQQGVCTGGTMKACPGLDSCHVGVCDEQLKTCTNQPGNDGAQCDDLDACTGPGVCQNGACGKGSPIDCTVFDGQCTQGVCMAGQGCVPTPSNEGGQCDDGMASPCSNGLCTAGNCNSVAANEGGPCDDGKFCTIGDHCESAVCKPTGPNICAPPGGCYIGVCDEINQTCTSAPGNDGSPCDDFNGCTDGTTCSNGACINGVAANEGLACDDGSDCTSGTTCTAGVCGGGVGPTVYFADDFHDNSKGWQLGTEWQIGPAMVSFGGDFGSDPATDHSASVDNGVAGIVIGGNESPVTHDYYYLTSPSFNTANAVGSVILGYYRWLNSDYPPYMYNTIDVWNGSSWINVWTNDDPNNPGNTIDDTPADGGTGWTFFSFDVTAQKNAAMQIRFGYAIMSAGVFTVGSWNVDDVLVASAACP